MQNEKPLEPGHRQHRITGRVADFSFGTNAAAAWVTISLQLLRQAGTMLAQSMGFVSSEPAPLGGSATFDK